ncbi:MAG: hypothetical protein K5986_11315 [Clostridium sp.]|nr:hypothetical protein [Clostridium sp.]
MPYKDEWAKCPKCSKEANSLEQVEELFGYRNMGDGRVIPQSYCKECRRDGLKNK